MEQPHGSQAPYAAARHFLGAELRRWRHRRELSVVDLARRIDVSRELVQKVETAQRRATLDLIRACDTALDTDGPSAGSWTSSPIPNTRPHRMSGTGHHHPRS